MKSKILLLMALGFTVVAQAQTDVTSSYVPHKDPFYLQITAGANHSMNENTDMNEDNRNLGFKKLTYDWFGSIGMGSEFTNVLGWRLTAAYNGNRGACNWYYDSASQRHFENENPWKYSFKDADAFLDLTIDLLDLFAPNRVNNRFDLKALVGVGAAYVWGLPDDLNGDEYPFSDDNGIHFGARVGLRGGYWVSKHVELGLEADAHGFDDKFTGYKYKFPLDLRPNLGVFVAFNFAKEKAAPVVEPEPLPVVEQPIVYTPTFLYITPLAEGVKQREISGRAYLDFVVNKTDIRPTYHNNEAELAKIRSSIDAVKDDPTLTITAIGIHGYASPESPYSHNTYLAKNRAESLRQYLLKTYNMDGSLISTDYTPEDWDGLRKAVEEGNYNNKQAILDLIDGNLEPDAKEKKIKSTYPADYKDLLKNVYPVLRHSDYTIQYNVRDYTVEEAKEVIKTHPENLSQSEMVAVANSYGKGTEEYKNTLLTAVKTFPNDETANLNVAGMLLEEGNISEAEKYLDKCGNSGQANYVRGVAEALQKNYDKARTYFKAAEVAGVTEATDALKQITK